MQLHQQGIPPAHNWKSVQVSGAQTGATIWTPATGKRLNITHVQIGTQGATAGKMILWFGTLGDTTYTEGTDQPLFKGSFAPVAASGSFPIAAVPMQTPIQGPVDQTLKITTSAALDCDVVIYGYES